MSTLTKVLIVLLTLSVFLLCGIVVTYVGMAGDYKQQYKDIQTERDALKENNKHLTEQLNTKIDEMAKLKAELNSQITTLKSQISEIKNELNSAEREKANLLQRVSGMASSVETTSQTAEQQRQLFEDTFAELKKIQAQQTKEQRQLNETTAELIKKMAIIDTLEAQTKRLLEEKTDLQNRLDELLLPLEKVSSVAAPVTPKADKAQQARAEDKDKDKDIDLKGLITVTDLKNHIASISIGSADGVREGMKFHVTRGDEFICDILILDVDEEAAVGILEMVEQQPKAGDNVSTNF